MTNNKDDVIKVIRPFGPSIARVKMPNMLVDNLNNYIDELITDKKFSLFSLAYELYLHLGYGFNSY